MKIFLEFGKKNNIILDAYTKQGDKSNSCRDTEIGTCDMQS